MDDDRQPTIGERVEVHTADGHRFGGRVLEFRSGASGLLETILLLDSGWQVAYPVTMVRPLEVPQIKKRIQDET